MEAIFNTDAAILLWIQENIRAAALTPLVTFITHLGDKGIFWIVLTLIMMCWRRTRKVGFACAISMLIGLIVTNLIIKNWVARIRPYELIEGLNLIIEKQKDFSFPSGHSTNSFACAWVIFRMMRKRWGVPTLILAILIALSRLYVGVHYPTDVLAGVVIGILSAEAAMPILRALRKRFPAFRRFTKRTKPKTEEAADRAA